jgi:4-hydroxy-tetrahydrodipicolinate reductase
MQSLKIAILGYGKMGQIIEEIALERGHTISLKVGIEGFQPEDLKNTDVAIEFSVPQAAAENIKKCAEAKTPVVVGTTAWYERYDEVSDYIQEKGGAMLAATNFSIGVNVFFMVNRYLSKLMNGQEDYDVYMKEIHHLQKLDAPSGTAITLAEGILEELDRKNNWVHHENPTENKMSSDNPLDLHVYSDRKQGVPGTHRIVFENSIDKITIEHEAKNRKGFALGSVLAAEWLHGKKGVFTMQDLLKF